MGRGGDEIKKMDATLSSSAFSSHSVRQMIEFVDDGFVRSSNNEKLVSMSRSTKAR